jgi:ferric-dicitrate binding protein FerR (iron transport regulator)
MSRDEFDLLLEKYLLGNCTPAEEQRVLRWYHQLISQSEVYLSDTEKQAIEERIWSSIKQDLHPASTEAKEIKFTPRFPVLLRVAAAVLLLVLGGVMMYTFFGNQAPTQMSAGGLSVPDTYLKYSNTGKSQEDFLLADSSVVRLQPGSSLYYPDSFKDSLREVYLEGNAFFSIHHDAAKPFFVHTVNGLLTRVLGTSFSINQDVATHTTVVRVATGRVGVYEEKSRKGKMLLPPGSIVVTPNQKVEFNAKSKRFVTSLVEDPRPLDDRTADKNAALNFTGDRPLWQVLEALSKVYGVNITAESEAVANCPFTGDIRNYDLYEQLSVICQALNDSYEINGTSIVVKGSGCE